MDIQEILYKFHFLYLGIFVHMFMHMYVRKISEKQPINFKHSKDVYVNYAVGSEVKEA